MKLINGKFYENNKVIPIEIGNEKQIAILKKVGAIKDINENSNDEDIEPINIKYTTWNRTTTITFDFKAFFTCVCGNRVISTDNYIEIEDDEEGHEDEIVEEVIEGEVVYCNCCDREYTITEGKAELNK